MRDQLYVKCCLNSNDIECWNSLAQSRTLLVAPRPWIYGLSAYIIPCLFCLSEWYECAEEFVMAFLKRLSTMRGDWNTPSTLSIEKNSKGSGSSSSEDTETVNHFQISSKGISLELGRLQKYLLSSIKAQIFPKYLWLLFIWTHLHITHSCLWVALDDRVECRRIIEKWENENSNRYLAVTPIELPGNAFLIINGWPGFSWGVISSSRK